MLDISSTTQSAVSSLELRGDTILQDGGWVGTAKPFIWQGVDWNGWIGFNFLRFL